METKTEMKEMRLRAHHGMCLAFFQGKGYSSMFTQHMARVKEALEEHPGQPVRVIASSDVICSACPELMQEEKPARSREAQGAEIGPHSCPGIRAGVCRSAEKTERYDRAVLKLCGLEEGTSIQWQEFEHLVEERILRAGKRQSICGDCQWNALCGD